MVFPASALLTNRYDIIVTREGVVKYSNQIIVVEHKGRIVRLTIELRVTSTFLVVPLHQGEHSRDTVSIKYH